jgi:hypothetical protein
MLKTVMLFLAVGLLGGCSSNKELNERSGRALLQDAVATRPFLVYLSGLQRTRRLPRC